MTWRPGRVALVALAGLGGLAACGGARPLPENPAYVVRPTPESRQALARAVEQALGRHVTLDDDALTQSGTLIVERLQLRDPRPIVVGRDPGDPGYAERFHLVKIGEHCVLVHDRSDRHFDLAGTSCEPM